MAKKPAPSIPADRLDLYERLVATNPTIERKGAKVPYTSLNGHMFSFLTPEGTLALRLGDDDRAAFLNKFKTALVVQHGRVMKEYVSVPDSLMKKTNELKRYFQKSLAYVATLKPKSTTRKQPSAKSRKMTVSKKK